MPITRARVPMIVGALMAVSLVAAGCGSGGSTSDGDSNGVKDVLHSKGAKPDVAEPAVHANVQRGATAVPVDRRILVTADSGTLTSVAVTSRSGTIPGKLSADRKTWTAGTLLEPGTTYTVISQATVDGGRLDRLLGGAVGGPSALAGLQPTGGMAGPSQVAAGRSQGQAEQGGDHHGSTGTQERHRTPRR